MPLFKRRIRSALYVDFENFKVLPPVMPNVLAWLEDGVFDTKRGKRRFLHRRLYLNSQANKHRKAFEAVGFEVIEVEHYGGLHNGADIRIAVDMIEAAILQPKIEEYILFTLDSDFVPLIQKLGTRGRQTVMLVDEHKPVAKTAYDLHADATIARRILSDEAETYVRPRRSLFGRRKASETAPIPPAPSTDAVAPVAPSKIEPPSRRPASAPQSGNGVASVGKPDTRSDGLPQAAIDAFVKVASRNVGQPTARTSIMKELSAIPGFTHNGRNAHFGLRSYKALAESVSKLDHRIKVKTLSFGGISVTYAANETDASPLSARPADQTAEAAS